MARTARKSRWYAAMREKLGVKTNAQVRAFMKKQGAKAKHTGKGGFKHMKDNDPERLKAISSAAINKRWHGEDY